MKLLDYPQPPTCLHILGQGLVDTMWHEGQELKRALAAAPKAARPLNFEHTLLRAAELLYTIPCGSEANCKRFKDILYAMRGYLTEEGTTIEQTKLLTKIGIDL